MSERHTHYLEMTHIMTNVLMRWKHIDYIHGDVVLVCVTLPHLGGSQSYPVFKFQLPLRSHALYGVIYGAALFT